MVSKKSQQLDQNPNPKSKKNALNLVGIPVEFPYQPYGSQLSYMSRVISTLDRAQRDGHCHALLESPTGTGKSLSLLCATLAWQKNHQSKLLKSNLTQTRPAPEAFTDPMAFGGGFVPEVDPSGNPNPAPSAANSKNQRQKTPKIFYATRTHSQITQAIREYRKTSYRVPMAVLASRKHYCTNTLYRGKSNLDEQCKLLLRNEVGCSEFKNVHRVKGHPSLQKGGCNEVHDIEDLVKVGQAVKGCSYFAARWMGDDAQLVFCPYNYIVSPVVRRAMEVDISGAIVILDEAHNIEDISREAGSFDVEEDVLLQLQTELEQLSLMDAGTYEPLHETVENIISWIERRKQTLEKHGFQHYVSCWTGDKALKEFQEASISQQSFPTLQECATKAIKAASDAEPDVAHLSGMPAIALEGLFSSLNFFYSGNGIHINDYQLVLQRYLKRDGGNSAGDWTCTFSLWCLNPAVVFKEIADLSLSVILTSGTLSPVGSFSSELGVQFGTSLEAPHVIDVDSQLWAAALSTGPGNYPLNASYRTADAYAFQDSLGASLEEICKIVPAGCLVFFPSYKLMDKLSSRWRETGQWSRLNAQKSLFVEPRAGNQDDFDDTLKAYYDSIRKVGKCQTGRKRKGKILGLKTIKTTGHTEKHKNGAAFLAVCRGKVSEGIDFSDENARVVVIVGIPFPNIYDIQVAQKKKFNDTYKLSKNLLSGNEWYCQQAFRALNQAAGRCIRHRFDYGAVIFIDERFREERNTSYMSKWLRKSIRQYDNFEESLEGLRSFFRDVTQRVVKNANILQISDVKIEEIGHTETCKDSTNRKGQNVNNSVCFEDIKVSNNTLGTEKSAQLCKSPSIIAKYEFSPTQRKIEVQTNVSTDKKDSKRFREYIDLESDLEDNSRCRQTPLVALSPDTQDVSLVKGTPDAYGNNLIASYPESPLKDEVISSAIPQLTTELPGDLFSHQVQLPDTAKSKCLFATPETVASTSNDCLIPETDSSLNLSVNSHIQKRRKSLVWSSINCMQSERSDSPDCKTAVSVASSVTATEVNSSVDYGHQTNCSESKFEKFNIHRNLTRENFGSSSTSSDHVTGKRVRIFCSLCKRPLGLPENDLYVTCSITYSSKSHLATLRKEMLQPLAVNMSSSVPVMVCDMSAVNKQLFKTIVEDAGQGIWCKEDGCVFNTIFCPFCSNPKSCLGVQVMATDSSNVQLLNKILFYLDRLEIKNPEVSNDKDLSPSSHSCISKSTVLNPFEKFSYSPQLKSSEGWRTTRSKMRLPKRGGHATSDKEVNG